MKKKIIINILLIFIWASFIFYMSNMNSNESNNDSKQAISKVFETTKKTSYNIGIKKEETTQKEKNNITNILNYPIRKLAHITEYFILSLLILSLFNTLNIKKKYLLTILICFLYACTDEFHQIFTGRTSLFTDTLIDTFGSALASFLYYLYIRHKSTK